MYLVIKKNYYTLFTGPFKAIINFYSYAHFQGHHVATRNIGFVSRFT